MSIEAPVRPAPEHDGRRSLTETTPNARRRKAISRVMSGVLFLTVMAAVTPLAILLWQVLSNGWGPFGWEFLTTIEPLSYRETGGGYLHGIVGTLYMTGVAALISVPLGVAAAIYLTDNPTRRCPDLAKARTHLGYEPRVGLEEGLERTLRWYAEIQEANP